MKQKKQPPLIIGRTKFGATSPRCSNHMYGANHNRNPVSMPHHILQLPRRPPDFSPDHTTTTTVASVLVSQIVSAVQGGGGNGVESTGADDIAEALIANLRMFRLKGRQPRPEFASLEDAIPQVIR